jgi:peptidoglycan/xylan/chitin deacetylase (PgdA/CDA1 family)
MLAGSADALRRQASRPAEQLSPDLRPLGASVSPWRAPGAIILLHVWYSSGPSARAALPLMIDKLRGEGYEFVTVDELLHIHTGAVPVVSQP